MGFVEIISLTTNTLHQGEVFLANHLASTDNLTRTTKRQKTYKHKPTEHKKWP